MWALGVICYILLSGFSPFMGDNDAETYINISSVTFDYDCEEFDEISENAKVKTLCFIQSSGFYLFDTYLLILLICKFALNFSSLGLYQLPPEERPRIANES